MVKLFQRIEVWILLVVMAGAGLFVHFTSQPEEAGTQPVVRNVGPQGAEPAAIRHIWLERDHGNARLDIDVRVINKHPKVVQLVPPFVVLRNGAGREVPAFFLPVEPPPSLPANSTADVNLRFWLEKGDLEGPLQLEIDGQNLPVKAAAPVDLSKLENFKLTEMTGPPWQGLGR